jgi:O-acetylhomoserine/O-acetylserine sulfhydrylase-like pyridoxal-dependent enzyme
VTDHTPLALGYLRQYLSMTGDDLGLVKKQMQAFAEHKGFILGMVFVEQLHTDPAAFDALVTAANLREITVVIVPTRAHLSAVGRSETKMQRLERESGARALVADWSPP